MSRFSCLVFILLLGSPAGAKERTIGDILKNIKVKSKKIKINKYKTALPKFKGATGGLGKIKVRKIKPPLSFPTSTVSDSGANRLERITDEEIKQLYKLTKKYRKSKTRGEIWLRLAEAYVDKARAIELRLQFDYDRRLSLYQKGKLKRIPKLNLKPSYVYNKKSIELYHWFLKDFPKDSKIDQALFFLGYNEFELGNIKKGLTYYRQLLKNHSRSRFVGESYFAIAEYYFENENWGKALGNYLAVSKRKKSKLYSFSLYKAGWCYFKLGQAKKGLKYLEKVVRVGRKNKRLNRRGIRLIDESRSNMVLFFSEAGNHKNARRYFSKHWSSKEVDQLLERLAYLYVDMGKKTAARYVFTELISKNPSSAKSYDYQYQIVTMYSTKDALPVFRRELFDWVRRFGPDSRWTRQNKNKNPELVEKSLSLVETTLRTYTLQNHQTAQNSRGKDSQKFASDGYKAYFKSFKSTKHSGDMHFYYGELLYDMGRYKSAAEHYLWVAENDPKSKYYEKSTLNAILSMEKDLPSEEKIKKIVGTSSVPIALDRNTKLFERVVFKYFKAMPKSKNIVAVKYKLANLYHAYNHVDKALELYDEIVKKHPNSKYAENSGHIILDTYNTKKDFVGLHTAAMGMLKIPTLSKTKFGNQVRAILEKTGFKQARELERGKNYVKSAEGYAVFAKKHKSSDLKTSAYYNAAINYSRAGKVLPAIENYKMVISVARKKDIDLKRKSIVFLAELYDRIGQFSNAADLYERSAADVKNAKKRAGFYYNAGIVRMGMRRYKSAIRNFENYYALEKSSQRAEALYLIATIWSKRRNVKKATSYYLRYFESNPSSAEGVMETAYKLAHLYEKRNYKTKSKEWYTKTIRIQKNLAKSGKKIGVAYAAEAKFKLTYDLYTQLSKIKIPKSPSSQGRVLKTKIALIEKLKKQLKEVMKYDDGYQIVSSLVAIGQANQHMSAALFSAPLPKGLTKEEKIEYKKGIALAAEPFKKSAIESYTAAVEKALTFEVYSHWISRVAQPELSRLEKTTLPLIEFEVMPTKLLDRLKGQEDLSKYKDQSVVENLLELRGVKDASKIFELSAQILSSDPDDVVALNSLALLYYDKNERGLSKLLLNRIIKKTAKKDTAFALNNLGVLYVSEGEIKDAVNAFRSSLRANVNYEIAAVNLGAIALKYGDLGRALSSLEDGYDFVQDGIKNGDETAQAIGNNYALALIGNNDYSKAESILDEIFLAESRNATILLNYAVLLVRYLDKKSDATMLLTKIKYLTGDRKKVKLIHQLQKEAYEKK